MGYITTFLFTALLMYFLDPVGYHAIFRAVVLIAGNSLVIVTAWFVASNYCKRCDSLTRFIQKNSASNYSGGFAVGLASACLSVIFEVLFSAFSLYCQKPDVSFLSHHMLRATAGLWPVLAH